MQSPRPPRIARRLRRPDRRTVGVYQESLKAKNNKDDEAAKEIEKVTSLFDLDESFAGDPVSMAIMYMTYREVAKDRLLATGEPALAKAQALDHLKPVENLTNAKAGDRSRDNAAWPESGSPTLAQRAYYNALWSFYTGTALGSAILAQVAAERRMVESGASDEKLLREFYPALLANRPDQRGRREVALQSLKSAPQRHKDILADLACYNAMQGYSSLAEAAVALIGQAGGSLPTPEAAAGPMGKGMTLGARFLSGARRQGAANGVVNPAVQALSVAGGGRKKYDPWQHAMSVGVGALAGGAGAALFGRRLAPVAGEPSSSAPSAHAPEGLPAGVRGDEAAVAPKPEAQVVAPLSSDLLVGSESAGPIAAASGKEVNVTSFAKHRLGDIDQSSGREIVQGDFNLKMLLQGAQERKPILEADLQRIAADIEGANFLSARVKDEPGMVKKNCHRPPPLHCWGLFGR